MSEAERTTITNGDDMNTNVVDVIESGIPGIYEIVVLNADGSSI